MMGNPAAHTKFRTLPLGEANAAIPASHSLDVTGDAELMDHLHKMVLGNPVIFGNLGNRREVFGLHGQMDQNSQRVVGIGLQTHRDRPRGWP